MGEGDEHRRHPKIKWKLLINYLQEINYDRVLAVKLPTYDVSVASNRFAREICSCESILCLGKAQMGHVFVARC